MAEKKKAPHTCPKNAASGLKKIAFGRVNDAVRLMLQDGLSPAEMKRLDLNSIAEMKQTKEGLEIKFYDRMKALECLRGMEEDGGGQSPLYRALIQSTRQFGKAKDNGV